MTTRREHLAELNPEMLFLDGFDEALIGACTRFNQEPVALYDRNKIIEILMRDMPYEEAEEYFGFNIIGAWVGENTPAFAELMTGNGREEVSSKETPDYREDVWL